MKSTLVDYAVLFAWALLELLTQSNTFLFGKNIARPIFGYGALAAKFKYKHTASDRIAVNKSLKQQYTRNISVQPQRAL